MSSRLKIHQTRSTKISVATPTKVSVGNTSTSVLSANKDRIEAVLVNDSDEDIYVSESGTAVINEGFVLTPSGSAVVDTYTGVITAICASGGKNLTVTEL